MPFPRQLAGDYEVFACSTWLRSVRALLGQTSGTRSQRRRKVASFVEEDMTWWMESPYSERNSPKKNKQTNPSGPSSVLDLIRRGVTVSTGFKRWQRDLETIVDAFLRRTT